MTDPAYTPYDRTEVIGYLGTAWPAPATATLLVLPVDTVGPDFTGAVAVWPVPGRPGTTWWAVDGVVPPQLTGTPDEALAALLPGSVLQTPPPPDGDPTPPLT